MREIRTYGSTGRGSETGLRRRLLGHEAGNGGHSQVRAYGYRADPRPYQRLVLRRRENLHPFSSGFPRAFNFALSSVRRSSR